MSLATSPLAVGGFTLGSPGAYVYRVYALDDELLYVGVTGEVAHRMKQHRRSSDWFRFAHRVEWEEWPDRYAALAAESYQIGELRPTYNVAMNRWEV